MNLPGHPIGNALTSRQRPKKETTNGAHRERRFPRYGKGGVAWQTAGRRVKVGRAASRTWGNWNGKESEEKNFGEKNNNERGSLGEV